MKKIIFFLSIIAIFIFFISNNNIITNKKYINYNKNIFIEYPYFNNKYIDNNLNNFITPFINKDDYLFIDYDIIDNNNLTMYIYKENNNIVSSLTKNFTIDNKSNFDYEFLNNKFINKNKLIALTFDDGPNHNTLKVLNILEKYNIKATFFILGTNIKKHEKIINRMNKLEMEIGNHMYSHAITTRLSTKKIKEELDKTDKLIYDITKKYPTLIRPSYGIYNKKFQKITDRPIILWNIDTLDWKYHSSKNIANKVFEGLKKNNKNNIILMHDIYNATANSLEIIIPTLLENNYQFVTVSELLYLTNLSNNQ